VSDLPESAVSTEGTHLIYALAYIDKPWVKETLRRAVYELGDYRELASRRVAREVIRRRRDSMAAWKRADAEH